MIPHHVSYQLAVIGCLWLWIMLPSTWPSRSAVAPQLPTASVPTKCKRQRTSEPNPFAGLPQRPPGAACAHEAHHPKPSAPRRPDPLPAPNRRPGTIDTSRPFGPHDGGNYRSWLGLGNRRANGHPSGGPWRPLYCRACPGYVLETPGTMLHGQRRSVALSVRVLACRAEGLGIRATARVFEVDANTGWQCLGEAAEQLQAWTRSCLCAGPGTQLQRAEWSAGRRGVREGQISAAHARRRLEPAHPGVWTAMDPVSKLLLVMEVGPRTVAIAQRVVQHVARV
jgi:hypothetical protein